MLDLLANRCLSSGTNAWTDTDHTCYTMTTAGSQGFLNLLPIYLDHILYPTLTPEGKSDLFFISHPPYFKISEKPNRVSTNFIKLLKRKNR